MFLRSFMAGAITLTTLVVVHAHFIFVVRDTKATNQLTVIFSDDLEVDEKIPAERLAGTKLTGIFDGGKEAPIETKPGKSCLIGELGLVNPQCVYGKHTLGVLQKGDSKPYLLAFHPKAIFAGANPKYTLLGEKKAITELMPVVQGGEFKFQFLAMGKPVADAEVSVMTPDGGKKVKTKTDADGLTQAFAAQGRYGAYARYTENRAGEHGGKKYDEARHYATLVVDFAGK